MTKIKMRNNLLEFRTSMKAWEGLNRLFLCNNTNIVTNRVGKAQYINDLVIFIKKPWVDPDFDFGRNFNYTKSKWKSLLGNYIDGESLNVLKTEIFKGLKSRKIFNIGYQFDNKHAHGKNCLLSLTVSRKVGIDKPVVTLFMRASEVTKRLICDLLLMQRIGEYLISDEDFYLSIHFSQIFNDDTVLLMYHVHEDIFKISDSDELKTRLKHLLTVDPETIKYKVHKRAIKVLRPELFKYPTTLAKDCQLEIEEIIPF